MKTITLFLTLLICGLITEPAWAQDVKRDYPLPEVIGILPNVDYPDSTAWGARYCSIGDVNGDGCDDLMVTDPSLSPGSYTQNATNNIMIYLGGNPMDNIIDAVWEPGMLRIYGSEINYLGKLIPGKPPMVAIRCWQVLLPVSEREIQISAISADLSPIATGVIHSVGGINGYIDQNSLSRPCDFNGDGHPDLITTINYYKNGKYPRGGDTMAVEVYYGGADFDTLPDWRSDVIVGTFASQSSNLLSAGRDVNGDGYDDFLMMIWDPRRYVIFLGGETPSTTPALVFGTGVDSTGRYGLGEDLDLVPDFNGDGYDDWVISFNRSHPIGKNSWFLFYGSETPDSIPDAELAGFWSEGEIASPGSCCGGDFNGDRYGDIIVGSGDVDMMSGRNDIYFGHPGQPKDIMPDIKMGTYDYEDPYILHLGAPGGVGDYNGDGVDDFINTTGRRKGIYAGNRVWKVGVNEYDTPQPTALEMTAYPNPINGVVTLSIHSAQDNLGSLSIYDIDGREAWKMDNLKLESGATNLIWDTTNIPAGVYIVLLQYGSGNQIKTVSQKLVVLK